MSGTDEKLSRRNLIKTAALGAAGLVLPGKLLGCQQASPDLDRLKKWVQTLKAEGLNNATVPLGRAAVRVGELAAGTPYQPYTLEEYLKRGGSPTLEPLTLSLTRFDCVTLVEACLAVARLAWQKSAPTWKGFGREVERMRYRDGRRAGYISRLHYFSEWISDGESRRLLKDMGAGLGAAEDTRPLRFMTEHRDKYPALRNRDVVEELLRIERRISERPRRVIPTKRIPEVVGQIETGDVLAFATEIPGLDVTHTAFAYGAKGGTLRVLHAPLSGGVVEVTKATLPEYVAAIKRSTGILIARPT
jgi:hypothetical protein